MWKYKLIIILLLLTSYYISIQFPLFGDEALYSIAIKDNIELGLQPTATYFGQTMYWKPALMFNVYAIIASPLYGIIPEEILFRTVSLLFVVLSLFVLFKFFKEEFKDEKKAYLGLIVILITPCFFVFSIKVLTDTLMFFFICAALLMTQSIDNKWNKLFLLISLIGIGLTKSIAFTLFTIILISIYYLHKNKKINWNIIYIGIISIVIILGYSIIFNLEKLNSADLMRLNFLKYSKTIEIFTLNISRIFAFLGIIIFGLLIFKKEKMILFAFTIVFLIYLIINGHYVLPWYLFPVLPLLTIFFVEIKKPEIIVMLILYNLLITLILLSSLNYANYNFNSIIKENLNETIYIGRLGELVANEVYEHNGVIVTPTNSFKFDLNNEITGDRLNNWYGYPEKMTKENILGLIYDYENIKWWPPYTENLTIDEKYIPPISRTHKTFEGPFKQIIIEEQYYLLIENVILNDYELVKIIDEEKTEDKVEQKMYILSIKENLE